MFVTNEELIWTLTRFVATLIFTACLELNYRLLREANLQSHKNPQIYFGAK